MFQVLETRVLRQNQVSIPDGKIALSFDSLQPRDVGERDVGIVSRNYDLVDQMRCILLIMKNDVLLLNSFLTIIFLPFYILRALVALPCISLGRASLRANSNNYIE